MSEISNQLASSEEIIEEARQGKMFILVDAEDRENEGDIVIPARMVTPEIINFMATHARGLICLTIDSKRAKQLNLNPVGGRSQLRHGTAFTTSIEARHGVTTGISAHDRAHTVMVATDSQQGAQAIVSPGHVFPIVAKDGGVLTRAGHTEASVDIARLAGLEPSGVICEIMKEDGTMARLPDLIVFAQKHGMKISTIADLISYRRRHDNLVHRRRQFNITTKHGGDFDAIVYGNTQDNIEHIALIKGDITTPDPVAVRMHAVNIFDDLLTVNESRHDLLQKALKTLHTLERGILVLLRDVQDGVDEPSTSKPVAPSKGQTAVATPTKTSMPTPTETPVRKLREYGMGAQILCDLGVHNMILLSDTHQKVVGLEGYGLHIVEQRPLSKKV